MVVYHIDLYIITVEFTILDVMLSLKQNKWFICIVNTSYLLQNKKEILQMFDTKCALQNIYSQPSSTFLQTLGDQGELSVFPSES